MCSLRPRGCCSWFRRSPVRGLVIVLVIFLVVAAARRRLDLRNDSDRWTVLLCTSLALVPLLILYGLSVGTSIHVFVPRYRLVAVPGIALCWALVVSWIDSRVLRLAVLHRFGGGCGLRLLYRAIVPASHVQLEECFGLCGEKRFCRQCSSADLQRHPGGRSHADARWRCDRGNRHLAAA